MTTQQKVPISPNRVPFMDYLASAAWGDIPGVTLHKQFGQSLDIGAAYHTLWGGGEAVITQLAVDSDAVMLVASSDDTEDTAAGDGALTVKVTGLDNDFLEVSETVTMDGQAEQTTTQKFLRVTKVEVLTTGVTGSNEGTIWVGTGSVTTGKPAVVYGHIAIGENKSDMAFTTVPANKEMLIVYLQLSCEAAKGVSFAIGTRALGGALEHQESFIIEAEYETIPINLFADEKTDIEIQVKIVTGASPEGHATIYYLLRDKVS